jgi:uncharacterized membrane protein YbhN (UPF0104 family)
MSGGQQFLRALYTFHSSFQFLLIEFSFSLKSSVLSAWSWTATTALHVSLMSLNLNQWQDWSLPTIIIIIIIIIIIAD